MDFKEKYIKYKKKYIAKKKEILAGSEKGTKPPSYGTFYFNYSFFDNFNSKIRDEENILNNRFEMIEYGEAIDIASIRNDEEPDFDFYYSKWISWMNVYNQANIRFNNSLEDYDDPKFKLFSTESFINSEMLQELIIKYQEEYKEEYWTNNEKPNFIELYDINNISFIQKIKFELNAKVIIIGDIHSSLHSCLGILLDNKDEYFEEESDMILKPNHYIIFLGDLVDRGPYSMEILVLIFGLKNKNFDNVFIINGNHEEYTTYRSLGYMTRDHGFVFERIGLEKEYEEQWDNVTDYEVITSCDINIILFMLPSCIYLSVHDKFYHFSHGAFDPKFGGVPPYSREPLLISPRPTRKSLPSILDSLSDSSKAKDSTKKQMVLSDFLESDKKFHLIKIWQHGEKYSSNYKWGDFDNTVYWLDKNHDRDPTGNLGILRMGINATKDYMEKNNIINLITGHQDQRPLSFLLENVTDKFISYPDEKYNLHTFDFPGTDEINKLFTNIEEILKKSHLEKSDTDEIKELFNKIHQLSNERFRIKIEPSEFLALITSTATISRFLKEMEAIPQYNSFLFNKVFLELIL